MVQEMSPSKRSAFRPISFKLTSAPSLSGWGTHEMAGPPWWAASMVSVASNVATLFLLAYVTYIPEKREEKKRKRNLLINTKVGIDSVKNVHSMPGKTVVANIIVVVGYVTFLSFFPPPPPRKQYHEEPWLHESVIACACVFGERCSDKPICTEKSLLLTVNQSRQAIKGLVDKC